MNVVLGYLAAHDDLPEQVVKSLEILANRAHNRLQAGWDEQAVRRNWPRAYTQE